MSPIPAELGERRTEAIKQAEELQKELARIGCLNEALQSVFDQCGSIFSYPDRQKGTYKNFGYYIDNKPHYIFPSAHPLVMSPNKREIVAFMGRNFTEHFPISGTNPKKWHFSGWSWKTRNDERECPVVYFGDGAKTKSLKIKEGYYFFYSQEEESIVRWGDRNGFGSHEIEGIVTERKNKEWLVIALANAAGIKPEDESNPRFPMLLTQLKRIANQGM